MKKFFTLFFLLTLFFTPIAFAEETTPPASVNIHLKIFTSSSVFYDNDINVLPCNNDNNITELLSITAYCAILQSGVDNSWNWEWAPGAFLNSLGGISGFTTEDGSGSPVYHYWSWSINGNEGMVAMNQYELQNNDSVVLEFIDPQEEIVIPATETVSPYYSQSTEEEFSNFFDLEKGFDFLISNQKENGSFGEELYTDWSTIALMSTDKYQDTKIRLIKYYTSNSFSSPLLTDNERYSMALMSLGLNPYNTNGENYIEKISKSFDGEQFGDKNEDNDDIFAILVLNKAGHHDNEILTKGLNFVLKRQRADGSWDGNPDMTSAGIIALSPFREKPEIKESLERAENFLEKEQEKDGGWGNISSTSWATQGILALGEKPETWTKNDESPLEYIARQQDKDGGIKGDLLENRVWETSYVLVSLSEKTWNEILQRFDKPKIETNPIAAGPIVEKINNSHLANFTKKVQEFQKTEIENIETQNIITDENSIQKTSWFRRLLGRIFGF